LPQKHLSLSSSSLFFFFSLSLFFFLFPRRDGHPSGPTRHRARGWWSSAVRRLPSPSPSLPSFFGNNESSAAEEQEGTSRVGKSGFAVSSLLLPPFFPSPPPLPLSLITILFIPCAAKGPRARVGDRTKRDSVLFFFPLPLSPYFFIEGKEGAGRTGPCRRWSVRLPPLFFFFSPSGAAPGV